jgi:Winged helix DNA-binding domain
VHISSTSEARPLSVGYRRAIAERVLTTADLNRALLARQFLLERSRLSLTRTLDRIAGIQAQYAPSSYIGLWSRLEGFQLVHLTRALERGKVVQGTLLRSTIHLVSAGDYWAFAVGTRAARQEAWLRFDKKRLSRSDLTSAAKAVRSSLSGKVLHRDELLDLVRRRDPERPTHLWNGLAAWIDLVRAPPSGTWERRRADLYALADEWLEPPTVTPEESMVILLRRYLTGFGPARLADVANWAGLAASDVQQAADGLRLRRLRDQEGRALVDLPRAPLPGGATRAPARFLPTWDATLLVHARGTQILPERFRPLVFDTKTPHSTPTFLVGGAVAGKWSVEATKKKATLVLEPFERLPAAAQRELREEAERLVRFVEPDATSHAVRGG